MRGESDDAEAGAAVATQNSRSSAVRRAHTQGLANHTRISRLKQTHAYKAETHAFRTNTQHTKNKHAFRTNTQARTFACISHKHTNTQARTHAFKAETKNKRAAAAATQNSRSSAAAPLQATQNSRSSAVRTE
jgi:hypothetical protein